MKRTFIYQKSSLTALALLLALLEGFASPASAPEDPKFFPRPPVIGEESPTPKHDEEKGIQPFSDQDEIKKTINN